MFGGGGGGDKKERNETKSLDLPKILADISGQEAATELPKIFL